MNLNAFNRLPSQADSRALLSSCFWHIAVALPEKGAPTSGASGSPLSGRETEILRCISVGGSNKDVARQLGISPSTVRTHVENVFRKLHCTTRAAATLKALTLGFI